MSDIQLRNNVHVFDARGVAKRFVNDHDPLPLLAQLRQAFGEALGIDFQVRG